MLQLWNRNACLLALLVSTGTCFAQSPESKFYKLDFVVKEIEGTKVLNARAYSTTVSTDKSSPSSLIRTGSRVPVPTSPDGKQFNFSEVGVNIDCRSVQEVGGELSMIVTAEVTTTLQESTTGPPIHRQNKWTAAAVVPLRKPTVLFSSDDATTKRQMQLELTATPIK